MVRTRVCNLVAKLPLNVPWPAMRGDRRGTGVSPTLGVQWHGHKDSPRDVRWVDTRPATWGQRLTKGHVRATTINAAPIIGPDDVILVGSADHHLYGYYPHQNELKRWETGGIIDSAGTFADERTVYIASGDFSLYRFTIPPAEGIAQAPVRLPVEHRHWSPSSIYWFEANVVRGPDGALYAGNDNFHFYALLPDESSDRLRTKWAFPTGFFIWSAAAFSSDNRTLYVTAADMLLYALDAKSGRPRFTVDLDDLCVASPAVGPDEAIYFGTFSGQLYAVNGRSGQTIWTEKTPALIYASVALSPTGDALFVPSTDGVMRCYQPQGSRPQLRWEAFLGPPSFSSPSLGPDPEGREPYLVLIGTGNGDVIALEPTTGRRRWTYNTAHTQAENGHTTKDPVFRSSYRYPSINASIAIGRDYLATANSAGIIIAIPHHAYQTDPMFDRSAHDPWVSALHAGPRFVAMSPSGCIARTVCPSADTERTTVHPIDPGQTLAFTTLGADRERSGFVTLKPSSVHVERQGVPITHRLSPDHAHVFIPSPGHPSNEDPVDLTIYGETTHGTRLSATLCVAHQPIGDPCPPAKLVGRTLLVTQMAPVSPFAVVALDELGIASIVLAVKVISIDEHGQVVAYGYERFVSGHWGAPRRDLNYLFQGTYRDGVLELRSGPSYFETTAAPIPIDDLRITAIITHTEFRAVSLSLHFDWRGPVGFWRWFSEYAFDWTQANNLDGPPSRIPRYHHVPRWTSPTYWRNRAWMTFKWSRTILLFFWRSVELARSWHLITDQNDAMWHGTFQLHERVPDPLPAHHALALTRSRWTGRVQIAVEFSTAIESAPVLGVLVWRPATKRWIDINYVDVLDRVRLVKQQTLKAEFDLGDIEDAERCDIVIWLDGERIGTRSIASIPYE